MDLTSRHGYSNIAVRLLVTPLLAFAIYRCAFRQTVEGMLGLRTLENHEGSFTIASSFERRSTNSNPCSMNFFSSDIGITICFGLLLPPAGLFASIKRLNSDCGISARFGA